MTNKIYVGNVPLDVTEEDLVDNFGDLGNCLSAKIIRDRYSGISRGFAFVEMATAQEAKDAILKCRGVELDGNKLIVKTPKPKKSGPSKKPNPKPKG